MSIITSIKQQKDKNRVNIYLDGKFAFGLDLENFVKLNLRVEQELTGEQIDLIKNKAEFQKTLGKLLNFATRRPRSEKEIREWFYRKKTPEKFHKKLFTKLKYFDFIGDEKFAKWWVDQRISFRPKSKRVLVQELKIKGISSDVINAIFEETQIDEAKIAKELLGKKAYRWEKLEPKLQKQKATEYLSRNGFSWDVIKKVFNDSNH